MSGPPIGNSPIHAAGAIDALGTTGKALKNLILPPFGAVGLYTLGLEHQIDATECVVFVTFRGVAGLNHTATVVHTSDEKLEVFVANSMGFPANAAFDIIVFRTRVG